MTPRAMPTRAGSLAAMLQCMMRAVVVLAGLAVAAAPGAALAAAPDVVVTVVAYDGRKPIARAVASGRFGERLVAGVDGVMRVEMVVDPPGAHGFASMQMSRYRWVDGVETQDLRPGAAFTLALEAAPVDGCHPPNIAPTRPPEGFWICVMPRVGTPPPPTRPEQWPERTREALDRLRALLEDVHPAPIRDDDPAFRRWLVEG